VHGDSDLIELLGVLGVIEVRELLEDHSEHVQGVSLIDVSHLAGVVNQLLDVCSLGQLLVKLLVLHQLCQYQLGIESVLELEVLGSELINE